MNKLTLLNDHTHAGIEYRAGDVIEVNAAESAFLKEHGVAGAELFGAAAVETDTDTETSEG
jgi:hypothetical protein